VTEEETSRKTPVRLDYDSGQSLRDRVAELETANEKLEAELSRLRDIAVLRTADSEALEARVEHGVDVLADEARERVRAEEALSKKSLTLDETLGDLQNMVELLDLAHDTIFVHNLEGQITFWNRGAERTYGWTKFEALGKVSHKLLKTEFTGPLVKLMAKLLSEDYWEGQLVHTTRDGRRVIVASRWALRRDANGEPTAILEIDDDITRRKEAEAEAEAERKRMLTLLNLLPGYVVLKDRRCAIQYANHGFLEAFSEPNGRPCYEVQYGLDSPCEDCPITSVVDDERPEDWESTYPNGRTYHVWASPFADTDGSPLMLEVGIDVTRRKELELQVAEAGEIERRRIGRDLHDALGQNLTGLGYLIGGLADKLGPQESAVAEQIIEAVNEAVAQVRMLSRGLDPIGLEADGLVDALGDLAETFHTVSGVPCEFRCNCTVSLTEFAATHVYRIAQEALNNAARHAQARSVSVEVSRRDGYLVLNVEDDGVGITARATDGEGMGLRTMQYRASAIGGRLTARPAEGGGTVVTCMLPEPAARPGEGDRP